MAGKIIFIFVVVVALGLGLYLFTSGAFVKGAQGFNAMFPKPTSSPAAHASSSSQGGSGWLSFLSLLGPGNSRPISLPGVAGSDSGSGSAAGGGASGGTSGGATGAPAINPAEIPAGYTAAQLSPYFHQVRIGGAYPATIYNYGSVSLYEYGYYNATATIDVSGWRIVGTTGNEIVPQAENVYDPTGFAPETDILMKSGDTLYLYSTSAPFNLRLNKCIGYVAHVANFVPALPQSCPYTDQAQIRELGGQCQNYIYTIGQCQQPNFSDPRIPQTDYACMSYLENNYTYRSCFNQHYTDADFLSNQIWAWTGSNIVSQYHDTLKLFDRNGLLVDLYSY